MAQKQKPLTRQEIANLIIDTNKELEQIFWQFRALAAEEGARRNAAVRKLGFNPDHQVLRVT